MMPYLDIAHLEKAFGATRVVRDFSLGIKQGEFISLLGPSGCGKTTVLRMVAGFETPDGGAIAIEGRDIVGLRPNQRNIGMVFQAYALFPNLTVAQNVAFGLKLAGVTGSAAEARVTEMLRLIGLPELGNRYPFQLSGGQQQRVALARALAVRPRVLLLDEPLSALDAKIRVSLRDEIRTIQRELGITTIFVTHDQEEALNMSDRVVVMNGGVVEQVDTPFEIYNRPASRFVAQFVGKLNAIAGAVVDPAVGAIAIGAVPAAVAPEVLTGRQSGDTLSLALRPEAIHLGRRDGGDIVLPAVMEEVSFLGSVIRLKAKVGEASLAIDTFNRSDAPPPPVGSVAEVSFAPNDLIVLRD